MLDAASTMRSTKARGAPAGPATGAVVVTGLETGLGGAVLPGARR